MALLISYRYFGRPTLQLPLLVVERADGGLLRFDLTDYAPGIYTLYLKAEGEREQVRRFVVMQH